MHLRYEEVYIAMSLLTHMKIKVLGGEICLLYCNTASKLRKGRGSIKATVLWGWVHLVQCSLHFQ